MVVVVVVVIAVVVSSACDEGLKPCDGVHT